jgi:outer membrane protein OmpA-like peptidoglycan-associated protein
MPVVPLRWSATLEGGHLALSGLVRDEAARAEVLALARQLMPGAAISDGLTLEPNLSQTPDPSASTRVLLEALAGMTQGSASIQGQQAQLSGAVSDTEALRRLNAVLARNALPGGLELGGGITRIALRPYGLTASVDRTGVTFTGALPDEAARAALLAAVEASPLTGKLTDETRIVPGAPAGFAAAAREAVTSLLRLDLGTARLSEQGLLLQGLTCRDLIKTEVETSIASRLPPGVAGRAEIALRQTGCVIDPPNTCQADLDALTRRNTVLFAQGAYAVTLDPATDRVIGEVFAILKQCPTSRITIEGHTNDDGQRRGFDNLALSERRAARVRDELVGRGVDPVQLDARGYGPERPLSPHGTDEARIMNRRVQFTVAK